ncbi:MAG: formate C-acetyltransferase/glycerol dehydratase family glycyl radical enzyme [Synergistaceae bacterium]|jgi:formate C-acetyltransferase|nr:formate C-acetyltransferase/glycerol dehydratase family glycyl radical enzyme [Synergistaceae bacterium]
MADKTQKKPYMKRIERLKERLLNTRPEMDLENAALLTRGFQESEGEPLAVQKAYAFRLQCMEKTVRIWDDELIAGNSGSKQRGGLLCADTCWSVLDDELDTISNREYDPFYLTDEDRALFTEVIRPYWKGRSTYEKWLCQIPEKTRILRDCGGAYINRKAVRGWGETTAGYSLIINEGIEGIERRIAEARSEIDLARPGDYEKSVYLRALSLSADGVRRMAKRYAREAERLAKLEKNPERRKELLEIAAVCDRVPEKPARTFREALQSFYFYQTCIFMEQNAASYNPGRMDQYLYPFYSGDLREGRITPNEAQELFDCLWVKFSEPCLFQDAVTAKFSAGYPMFQNVCVGGVDERGMNAVNDLSYMILQATMDVQLYQPSLSVRYNMSRNPNKFLRKVAELIKLGTGFPAFHSDEIGIQMTLNKGVPLKEAYDWNPCGCVETNLSGRMHCYTSYADYNLGLVVEFALNDGKSRKYGRYAGARTGDPRNFKNYEQFLDAVKEQIRYVLRVMVEGNHVNDVICLDRVCPALSMTFKECISSAKDYAWGGAKYNVGNGLDAIGVADLVNSVYAVRELVYDKKLVSMSRLLDALENDFAGYEDVLKLCMEVPKYGNDDEGVNELTGDLFTFIADYIESFDSRYGHMTAGILPVSGNTPFGLEVGALPSGRKAYMPLADGISPSGGTDLEGMGAIIKSASYIPHGRFSQGTLLNLKLDPVFNRSEQSTENLMAFLKSMCSLGVFHAQFNVINKETLLDAQERPEEHKGLLIRVAGYTAYFTELGREVQDDIISRTAHEGIAC